MSIQAGLSMGQVPFPPRNNTNKGNVVLGLTSLMDQLTRPHSSGSSYAGRE